jgi:hypothetical protein
MGKSGLVGGLEAVSEFGVHVEVENRGRYKLCSGTVLSIFPVFDTFLTPYYQMKHAPQQL